jgi:hypothetical protein
LEFDAGDLGFRARAIAVLTAFLCSPLPLAAQTAPQTPEFERRVLCDAASASQWVVAESTVEASATHAAPGKTLLHWHVPVDHLAGEVKYPIGWPRAHWALRDAAARDWSEWDFLQLRVYTDTSRETLPWEPVGLTLYTPDKAGAYHRPLTELRKGAWTDIRLPLAQVPRTHDVRLLQVHVAESKYRHQDRLDLYFDEIALLRYAEPTLVDFAAESAVMFADSKVIPVRCQLLGVKPGVGVEIACQLQCDGRVAARATAQGTRGVQRLVLDVSRQRLAPGVYELTAQAAGARHRAAAPLRLVESPWQ